MTLAEFLLARIAEDEAVATDAKDDHADADGHWWWDGVDFEGSWPTSEPPKDDKGACETLYTLAIPYVDHPDYHDEWRP